MREAALTALLVVLVGARVRVRPPRRLPGTSPDAPSRRPRRRVGGGRRRAGTRRRWWSSRAAEPDPGSVAAWCDELSRATRTGSTLPAAIRAAPVPASCGEQIGQLTFALDRGMPLRDAIAGAPRAPHLDLALTVLTACAEHGGHPGQPLDRAAATLRARAADLADRRTQSAQARLSAVVMTILPLLMLAVMLVASAPIRGALASPVGLVVLVIGGALNVLGWRWMQRLIDRPPR